MGKTTVVRAIAVKNDSLVSSVAGATYLIEDEAYRVPVVSIYTDNSEFFGNDHGILTDGSDKVKNYNKNLEPVCQIEYFDENGVRQICQMGTCKVSGHSSRSAYQKSLSVYARSAYGFDSFEYPFFENRDYTEYSALLLRNSSSDALATRMRDAVFGELSEGLDIYYAAARPVVVYINGTYYGHYNLREKANKDSLAQWEGITDGDIIAGAEILESSGLQSSNVVRGSNADWTELMNFCRENDLSIPENYAYVDERLDIDNFLTFAAYTAVAGSTDYGNIRVYRFPGGKWKCMIHDLEAVGADTDAEPINIYLKSLSEDCGMFPHWILRALVNVDSVRARFLTIIADVIESNFLYSIQVEPVFNKWMDALETILPRHFTIYRKLNLKTWRTNTKAVMYYTRIRPRYAIDYFCEYLNVSAGEKQKYFGHTLELLDTYNTK